MKSYLFYIPFLLLFSVGSSYSGWWLLNRELPIDPIVTSPFDEINVRVNQKVVAKIDKYFNRRHKWGNFNGTVLYADHGEVVYKKAFGYRDMKTKEPLETSDPFQLASVSKPITAIAVMLLLEEGLIELDDPIQKYLPQVPYEGVTIRQMLTHKSGMPNYMYFSDKLWPNRRTPISNNDVLCLMEQHKPMRYFRPNRKYNYSNTNYALLASLIEKVSGKTYEAYIQRNIFDRAGMKDAFVFNRNEKYDLPKPVYGYIGKRTRARNTYLNGVLGDKGIYASVDDLFKLDQALYTNELISQESQNMMYSSAHRRLWATDNYGLGWRVNTDKDNRRTVYHGGWWKGFRTYYIRELHSKKTIIVLSNSTTGGLLGTRELRALFKDQQP